MENTRVYKKMRFQNLFLASRDIDIDIYLYSVSKSTKMETLFSTLYIRYHVSSHAYVCYYIIVVSVWQPV
jgi:hypothetical protein